MKTYIVFIEKKTERESCNSRKAKNFARFYDFREAKNFANKFSGDYDIVICEDDPENNGSYKPERSHEGMRIVAQFWAVN